MIDPQPTLPDPRTANDDEIEDGRSSTAPAEGANDEPDPDTGSPQA